MLLVKDINKTYKSNSGNSTKALIDVNLVFDSKGLTFLTGKSGSGKSTLLNILGGLEHAESGEIIIKNKSSLDFTEEDFDSYRNTYLGFVFQDFGILENLSVGENIALSLKLQGYKQEEINKKVTEILDKVGLTNLSKRAPNELSGGQLQRVSIARALVKDPEIILADEPTANLDSETGLQIINLLKELSKEKLVIIVSHNNDYANEYADRIINLSDGKVIEDYYLEREIKNIKVVEKKSVSNKRKNIKTYDKKLVIPKTKLPIKYIFKSAISTVKNKRIKIALTIFLFTMSLFSLSISTLFSGYDISRSTINTMSYNDVESILVKKCNNINIDYSKAFDIEECDFNNISKDESVTTEYIVDKHNAVSYKLIDKGLPLPLLSKSENEDLYSPSKIYGFIEVPKDNIFTIIKGQYPSNKNEVMITDYLVQPISLFLNKSENDIIGSIFKYGDNHLTIVGVVDTNHEEYQSLSDIDYESMNSQEVKNTQVKYNELVLNQEKLFSRFIVSDSFYLDETNLTYIDDVKLWADDSTFLGYINIRSEFINDDITYPAEINDLSEDEVFINLDLFINRILKSEESLTKESILNDLTLLDKYLNQTFSFNLEHNNVVYNKKFTIKGFITEKLDSAMYEETIITSIETINSLSKVTYDGYYLSLSDSKKDNTKLFTELNENNFIQISAYSNDLYLFYGITQDLHSTLLGATIILAIFASVLIYVTMSNSINDKQKDIGILRSIGTSGNDVGYIFLIESLILTFISAILAVLIAYISTFFINKSLIGYYANNILFFSFGIRQVNYIILFSLIITLISTVIPITRLVKMKPIDVVRKK